MDQDQKLVDGGLPIGEAAARLGISVPALRKRIRRGSVHAHKVAGVWRISLPADVDAGTPAGSGRGQVDAGQDAVMVELRARVAEQHDRIVFLERLSEHQAGVIADLSKRLPELPAASPTPAPDTPVPAFRRDSDEVPADQVVAVTRTGRRRWWRWWRS